jgi:hypothetical protein
MRDPMRRTRRWSAGELICGLLFGAPVGFMFAALTLTAHVHPYVTGLSFVIGTILGARMTVGILRRMSRPGNEDDDDDGSGSRNAATDRSEQTGAASGTRD